eukprot:Gb_12541 [translate_table: standard]
MGPNQLFVFRFSIDQYLKESKVAEEVNKCVVPGTKMDCLGDVPSYIHCVRRTARCTTIGKSVLFVMPSEMKMLTDLQASKIRIKVIKANASKLQPVSDDVDQFLQKETNGEAKPGRKHSKLDRLFNHKNFDVLSPAYEKMRSQNMEKTKKTLNLFHKMQQTAMDANQFTFSSVINACSFLTALEHGKQIHSYTIRTGFESNVIVGNALIDMYANCWKIEDMHQLFDNMSQGDVVSWDSMIVGCAQKGHDDEANLCGQQLTAGAEALQHGKQAVPGNCQTYVVYLHFKLFGCEKEGPSTCCCCIWKLPDYWEPINNWRRVKGMKDSGGASSLFVDSECGYVNVCELFLQGGAVAYNPSELLCLVRYLWIPFKIAKPLLDKMPYVCMSNFIGYTEAISNSANNEAHESFMQDDYEMENALRKASGQMDRANALKLRMQRHLSDAKVKDITHRYFSYYKDEFGDKAEKVDANLRLNISNPRQGNAHMAQTSDLLLPMEYNWHPSLCHYALDWQPAIICQFGEITTLEK